MSNRDRAIVMLLELTGRNPSNMTIQFYKNQLDALEKRSSPDQVIDALSYYLKGTSHGYVFPSIVMLEKRLGLEEPSEDDQNTTIVEKLYSCLAEGKNLDSVPEARPLMIELGGYNQLKAEVDSGTQRNRLLESWKKTLRVLNHQERLNANKKLLNGNTGGQND